MDKENPSNDVLELSDLDERKQKRLLDLIYYENFHKFNKILEITVSSKGTVSKYLNALEDIEFVKRNINDDRTVEWYLTDKGINYLLKEDWIKIDSQSYNEIIGEIEQKKEKVSQYLYDKNLHKLISTSDLDELIDKFEFLEPKLGYMTEPELNFLKVFADIDPNNYEYAIRKKEN